MADNLEENVEQNSYTVDWIEPIFNRTSSDIMQAELTPDMVNPKGCYNDIDLNRIENNTIYAKEWLVENGITRQLPTMDHFLNWDKEDIPTKEDVERIVRNIMTLVTITRTRNPAMVDKLYNLVAGQMNYLLANAIEKNLYDIIHQPEIPPEMFYVKINNGIIRETGANEGYFMENDIITIQGNPYGDQAAYQVFEHWSGDTNDLQYIGDGSEEAIKQRVNTFQVQYHNTELTAVFKVVIPRTLALTNGHICVDGTVSETGPTTGIYNPGDQILIVAEIAPAGKAFFEWLGTAEGIEKISGEGLTDPSSAWLTMPDCDVELYPRYINAGQHYVTVRNGSGSGWYSYSENVFISPDIPNHYAFTFWSGDTGYLESTTAFSFSMPDVNVSLTANFEYVYSYNDVTVTNGLIDGQQKITSVKQSTSHPLTYTAPEGQGLDYWEIQGYGYVSGNNFIVGDGNAILTAHFNYIRMLTINNIDNGGATITRTAVQGHSFGNISTSSKVGDYRFKYWSENGQNISTSTTLNITAGNSDRVITAVYEYEEPYVPPTPPPTKYYTVTEINKDNTGAITTRNLAENAWITFSTQEIVGTSICDGIYKGEELVTSSYSYSTTIISEMTITYSYRPRENYNVSIENGYIADTGYSSGTFLERTSLNIVGNEPADNYVWDGWNYTGSVYSVGSSKNTTLITGRGDCVVSARYRKLANITVITNTITTVYTLPQGSTTYIEANPAADEHEFKQWGVESGDSSISNYLNHYTYFTAGYEDSTIVANYDPIPWFNVKIINGYVWNGTDWVEETSLIRNSKNDIKMIPAPENHQFLQWEVLTGSNDDVYEPLAETTRLRDLRHDVVIRATYYIPNPEETYTLTVENKGGEIQQGDYAVGTQIPIYAMYPDEGWEFDKWVGDTQYINDRYMPEAIVNMPAKNISIAVQYKREGYITTYHLVLENGLCLIGYDQQGEQVWDWQGEYPEGTIVPIVAANIPDDSVFNRWLGTSQSMSVVEELDNPITSVRIEDFDVALVGDTRLKNTYQLYYDPTFPEDEITGQYWEGQQVAIYFQNVDDEGHKYFFQRWDGTAAVEFRNFDVLYGGNKDNPQVVLMPAINGLIIRPIFTEMYRLFITNGIIDSENQFFNAGDTVTIIANEPEEGSKFSHWEGDTTCLDNAFNPTATVTMPATPVSFIAVYANEADRNGVGYTGQDINAENVFPINQMAIVSGDVNNGFLVFDKKGHMYMVTNFDLSNVTLTKLTKTNKGGNVYE